MQSQHDWKNIEMTGYIKLNKFGIDKENGEFQWLIEEDYMIILNVKEQATKGICFLMVKLDLPKSNGMLVMFLQTKKMDQKRISKNGSVTSILSIIQRIKKSGKTFVKIQNWIDDDGGSNLDQSNWKKVYEYVDNGDWGKEGKECDGRKDQIIT